MFVIQPVHPWWQLANWEHGKPLADGFEFTSDKNTQWLSAGDLRKMIGES
jgi:UDP-N-acetylglucosamine 4,6-dehydratase